MTINTEVIVMLNTALAFLNIGTSEMMLIIVVALLLFGGKKLPELARGLGRGIREFKDASETIKRDISDQINNFEKDLEVKDIIVDESKPKKLNENNPTAPAGTYQHTPSPDDYYGSDGYSDDYSFNNQPSSVPTSQTETGATETGPEEVASTDTTSTDTADSSTTNPVNEEKNA